MWKSADKDKGEADEAKGAPSGASDAAEGDSPKGGGPLLGKKLIVLLVAGLVLAGGGIGAVKFLGGGGDGKEKPEKKKVVEPLTWEFADMVVNILGTRDTRVLRVVLNVEVDNKAALDELRLREVVYRDEIHDILRSKTLEDLKYPGENAIKRQIRDRLNQIMIKGSVVEVYFKEFLIH
jgi:flagellar basal body-associated protein FliL